MKTEYMNSRFTVPLCIYNLHKTYGTNARKVKCGRVYSAYIFVNKNRCISVRLVSEEFKSISF